ncbi:MAG: transporter substrate-binding domain-containing protein [Spirochaetes bacterium]|nr:transporter substrate-binding domain-containing protein [Spirochaetota bacterium]MBU0956443.1 transporter substrate-binding domain-containing protein [Spirochaetota bacterium]
MSSDILSVNPDADSDLLSVVFSYQGESRSVSGQRLDSSTWLFNAGAGKKIRLATLDWPPYIGQQLRGQGWVQQVTVALLASRGYELKISYFPWARAVSLVENGEYDILYPEYYIAPQEPSDFIQNTRRLDHLELSEELPGGPVALVKRRDFAFEFSGDLRELHGLRIGVVQGYQNTPEFDARMAAGAFVISYAVDDFQNAQKLFYGRIDILVGDPLVITHSILASDLSRDEKNDMLQELEPVYPILQENSLYYAVSTRNSAWQSLLADLNQAIAEFKASGELNRLIADFSPAAPVD